MGQAREGRGGSRRSARALRGGRSRWSLRSASFLLGGAGIVAASSACVAPPPPPPSCVIGPGADLRGCDFSGDDLSGVNLAGANLSGAVLVGTDLAGANLTSADLRGADLTDARFARFVSGGAIGGLDLCDRGAALTGARLAGANLTRLVHLHDMMGQIEPTFAGVTYSSGIGAGPCYDTFASSVNSGTIGGWNYAAMGFSFHDATLDGSDLTGAYLSGLDLSGLSCVGCTLTPVSPGTTLGGANLVGADFHSSTGTPTGGATAVYGATVCPNGEVTGSSGVTTCDGRGFAT